MQIAILGNADSWYTNDLVRAADGRHEILPIDYQQLASTVGGDTKVHTAWVNLNELDAVLVRSMPPGSLEQIIFRMDALANLAMASVNVVNPPRSIEVAVDKYLATTRLAAAGLLVPKTITCQTLEQAMLAFEELGGDVVLKPLFGSEGRGIVRLSDEAIALRTFKALAAIGSVFYLQEFLEHEGCDLRLLVIGEDVLGMKRCNKLDWRTNISRGATGESLAVTSELAGIALQSAAAIGAPLAGVDLLPTRDGRLIAIEVNAVPGWRALSEVTGVDVALRVLRYLETHGPQ
ncbi:ATP-grasp domain-containing protein [Bythopirellula polymerisocia]|uniref:Alpha-aminoadipate--LysW ligase LysX n=1 Tax=Bythopirellula polymerisocia TaxID=2528003 RepID=A0A5C6CM12_9BACT|nr:RimK family alpha-L-glutamate ligase [Bythopirellula polymerisocia]TWU25610.1 Alpha-aminoadipate--LysW ligase LysX [Bythopirellula polymerisocia]